MNLLFEPSTGLQSLFIDRLEHPASPSIAMISISFIVTPFALAMLFDLHNVHKSMSVRCR